jgi:hypothetical protein
MPRSSSGSSSARVSRSRGCKSSKKTPSKPQLMQQNTRGKATMSQDVLDNEDIPARHGSYPAVQHAAAEAACTADVAAALAEAFCGSAANALTSSCRMDDCWQTHVTAGPHAAAATAARVQAQQQQLDAVLQADVLFDVCTAMEGLDGSCCSCSSTHEISSAEEPRAAART